MYMIPIKIETIFVFCFSYNYHTFVLLTGCSMFIPKDIVKEGTLIDLYTGGVYDFAGMLKSRNGYQNPNVQCSIPKYQFSRQ